MTGSPPTVLPLSLVFVVYREERLMARALESVAGLTDDILVIHDGPCPDRTLDIARSHGARVYERDHAGYCEAHRIFAYDQARYDWVMQLDADETLSPELKAALPHLLREPVGIYEISEPYPYRGKRYDGGFYKRSLYRKSAIRFTAMIHESVQPRDARVQIRRVDAPLIHDIQVDNLSVAGFRARVMRHIDMHARQLMQGYETFPHYGGVSASLQRLYARRLAHPVLLGMAATPLYFTFVHVWKALRYRSLFYLRMNGLHVAYNLVLYARIRSLKRQKRAG